MLIDQVEESLRDGKLIAPFMRKPTTTCLADLTKQIELLDETCPRYDINNVFRVQFPKMVESAYTPALTRNAELLEKRATLLMIASRAPLGRPWDNFYLEYRLNDLQRGGFLVRWDAEHRRHTCTLLYDDAGNDGVIGCIPDVFEILLGSDDMFGGYSFGEIPESMRPTFERQAELVRTSIELLNWDRGDVPTEARTQERKGKPRKTKKRTSSKRSTPMIIKFEPFLKENISGIHRGSGIGHAPSNLHLVRGHYKNFKHDAPLFGHKPVLGKTYGRLWVRPHKAGSPAGVDPKTPSAVIKIGELACA